MSKSKSLGFEGNFSTLLPVLSKSTSNIVAVLDIAGDTSNSSSSNKNPIIKNS